VAYDESAANRSQHGEHVVAKTELRAGALGLPAVLMQAVAMIAPAYTIIVSFQFAVTLVGLAVPVAFFIAMVILLMLTVSVSQLAVAFPSAGGFYTYLSRTLHPRVGFMSGWILTLWLMPLTGVVLAFTGGAILEPLLQSQYDFLLPWWVFALIVMAFVSFVVYRGIALSQRLLIVFALIEIVIVVALAASGLIAPGTGGFTLAPFNPAEALNLQGLYLGVVWAITTFIGWEGATPLAEESEDPRRNVPRSLVGSVIIVGILLLFCSWGFMVGLGTGNLQAIAESETLPPFTLAQNLWGGVWVIFLLAVLNSVIAVSIAAFNASTRLWFAMSRSGALPRTFARVHHDYRTPTNAIYLQIAVTLVCLILAAVVGPDNLFFIWALAITFGLILIYCAANVGVFLYYFREARDRFNPLLHAVFPLVASVAVLWVGYKSVYPLPPPPSTYAPIVMAVWFVIGIGLLVALKLRGREEWLIEAGRAVEEVPERSSAEEADPSERTAG
jgi:amino acid transporter